jgi:small GTP-binding protein
MKVVSVALVGPAQAGKSQLAHNFMRQSNKLQPYICTIGIDFEVGHYDVNRHRVTTDRGANDVKLQLWDCGGRPEFRAIVKSYVVNREAVICVFDASSYDSFNTLCAMMPEIVESMTDDTLLVVAGTHADMQQDVDRDTAKRLCTRYNARYFSCAANDLVSVNCLFESVVEAAHAKPEKRSADFRADAPLAQPPCCYM